jgi:PAS domain S-box-containing protein
LAVSRLRTPLKLSPVLAVGAAIALLVAGLSMALINEQQVRAQKLREVTVQAEILAGSVAGALAFDDAATAREYVAAMRANREVESVGVYGVGGDMVAGFAKEKGELPAGRNLGRSRFEGQDLIVTVPVVQGSTRLGSVYLRTVTEPLARRVARYGGVGLLIVMASLIVAIFGASNASLTEAHRRLEREMAERAKAEEALRQSQEAEAAARLAIETERGRAALRQSEQQLELALRAGRLGNWALDLKSGRLIASEVLRTDFGVGPDEAFDRYAQWAARVHPEDRARQQAEMDAAIAGRADLESEFRTRAPDGVVRWILVRGRAAYDEDGTAARMTGVSLDITARKNADERQRLLLDELNHRVKNTLASVQSIALQTVRGADPATFEQAFMARIAALARAHDLLTSVSWEGALLSDVVGHTLAPYVADEGDGRVQLSGPDVRLNPNAAVSLTMAFHELATNAGKYGSLSTAQGRVDVAWKVDDPARPSAVEIEWRESGGPPVSPPDRRGFGSRLVERGLAREFDGEVSLDFAPDGVVCRMRLPLSQKLQLAA